MFEFRIPAENMAAAIDELNKRALAYRESLKDYEEMPAQIGEETAGIIPDYSGNPDDYTA